MDRRSPSLPSSSVAQIALGALAAFAGVVAYAAALAMGGPGAGVGEAIREAGLLGAAAIALLVLGVGSWVAGCVRGAAALLAPERDT